MTDPGGRGQAAHPPGTAADGVGRDPLPPRLSRDQSAFTYDRTATPHLLIDPPSTIVFESHDTRSGALLDRTPGSTFDLPRPTAGAGNPVTGPIAINGAVPGDTLVVDVLNIDLVSPGWCGGHAHVGPVPAGRIPRPLGRTCRVADGNIEYGDGLALPVNPMIGCIGTAPDGEAISTGLPGRHGGNLDHKIVTSGSRVYLPVYVQDALLSIGDVHACQGDGELSGVGLEIGAEITVRVELRHDLTLSWPWVQTDDRIAVLTCAERFEDARTEAVDNIMRAIEAQLGLEPADALALISIAGDLRVGQAFGGMPLTLRLEMPLGLGIKPAA